MLTSPAAATEAQRDVLERMPVVRDLVDRLHKDGFSFGPNVRLFGTQHLMSQCLGLVGALHALGMKYGQMSLAGKIYSTHPGTYWNLHALGVTLPPPRQYDLALSQAAEQVRDLQNLARTCLGRAWQGTSNPLLLVLDDGGHALTNVRSWFSSPVGLAGVEQTASGFRQPGIASIGFPTVDVAASAVKRHCEPSIVIEAVLQRAGRLLEGWRGGPIGIVGLGYIGMALYRRLSADGFQVILFDERTDAYPTLARGQRARSPFDLLNRSQLVFGCTGADITRDFATLVTTRRLRKARRYLVSLSSGDDEFFTLKRLLLEKAEPATYSWAKIPDVEGPLWGSEFVILRNGFPINFDNGPESAPLEQIQGTLAALIGALCQASAMTQGMKVAGRTKLDTAFQEWLFDRWRPFLPRRDLAPERPNRTLIEKESEPRSEPRSMTYKSPFGGWTAERHPT